MASQTSPQLKILKKPEELIKPAKPTAPKILHLSNLDQLVRFPMNALLFYRPSDRPSDLIPTVKRAYSEILSAYPFMAGRLARRAAGVDVVDRFDIDCNSAGAVFVEAVAWSPLGDPRNQPPAFKDLISFPPEPLQYPLPLLRLQVTTFTCGAFCMGFTINHCLMDGLAAANFFVNFAAAARGLVDLPLPVHDDRAFLLPRAPPRICYEHPEYEAHVHNAPASTAPAQAAAETRMFHVPWAAIGRLKRVAEVSGGPSDVTTFEAVAAHVWRARALAVGGDGGVQSSVSFAVDVRNRLVPPAPAGFAGNAVIPTTTGGCQLANIREPRGLGLCAEMIRRASERISDEYIRSSIDFSEVTGRPFAVNGVCVSAWWKLPFYHADFGWGRPVYVCPLLDDPAFARDYLLFLAAGSNVCDGIDVYVTLEPHVMHEFHHHFHSVSLIQSEKDVS